MMKPIKFNLMIMSQRDFLSTDMYRFVTIRFRSAVFFNYCGVVGDATQWVLEHS